MNRQITRLAVVAVALLVVARSSRRPTGRPGRRRASPTGRTTPSSASPQFTVKRGRIFAADGDDPRARTASKRVHGKTLYFRTYPQGGLVRARRRLLDAGALARGARAVAERLPDRVELEPRRPSSTARSTARGRDDQGQRRPPDAEHERRSGRAERARDRCGAVVALEPRRAACSCMAVVAELRPEPRSSGHFDQAVAAPRAECAAAGRRSLNRATDGLYTPGSTFKVVTASAAIDTGAFTLGLDLLRPRLLRGVRQARLELLRPERARRYGTVNLFQAIAELDQLRVLQHRQAARARRRSSSTRGGSASTRSRRSRRPIDERKASGLYQNGKLWLPKTTERGRPGPPRVRPGAAAGDADADGHGRGDDRERRRGDEAVPRRRIVSPGRRSGRAPTSPDGLGRAVKPLDGERDHQGMIAAVAGGHLDGGADPGRHGRRQDRDGRERRRHVNTTWLHLLRAGRDPQRRDRGLPRAAERRRRHHRGADRQAGHGGTVAEAHRTGNAYPVASQWPSPTP